MMLIAGGDSFTWGNELPDCDESRFSRLSWSALLAQRLGLEYRCCAVAGSGNSSITRTTISSINKNPDVKFVAVMWSWPERTELRLRSDLIDRVLCKDGWYTLSVYRTWDLETRLKMYGGLRDDKYFIQKITDTYNAEKESGLIDLAELYLGNIHSEHYMQETLTNIYCLQCYLNERKIPYVFCSVTSQLTNLFRLTHPLTKMIDMSKWATLEGFVDFSKSRGFPEMPGLHYGPEAHAEWIDKYFHEDQIYE